MKYFYLFVALMYTGVAFASERPNIVWITTEDNSSRWLRIYDADHGVPMPNVERLAEQGFVFTNAFSNGAVCSVARSTLLSGSYAPRLGSQFHRHAFAVPFPEKLKAYPEYFREAGYYTANRYKEDYNFITEDIWDDSSTKASYRNRKPGQPFFQVYSLTDTHESRMHKQLDKREISTLITQPQGVELYPYHPDTPIFRKSYAHYYDKHRDDDKRIGKIIKQLEEDGLMDNTIIFYYGDHGGTLPRSKGYIYESGLQVPFVVYVPEKWKHLFPSEPGSRVDGFVSFIDFAPTVLNLAGIDIPKEMDGTPFAGKGIKLKKLNKRKETYGHADRFDEKYDLVRSYRKGRFKYMRSYQPFNIDGLYNDYRYQQCGYKELRELYDTGKLNEVQAAFFKSRAPEALYDIENDPHEIHNLANDPTYAKQLKSMRCGLQKWMKGMPDLSFFPESYLEEAAMSNPTAFGMEKKRQIARLIDIADLQLLSFSKAEKGIEKALNSSNPWERYWGLIVCSTFGNGASEFLPVIKKIMAKDSEKLNRLRAVEYMALHKKQDPTHVIEEILKDNTDNLEVVLILNSATLLKTLNSSLSFHFNNEALLNTGKGDKNREKWVRRRIEFITK